MRADMRFAHLPTTLHTLHVHPTTSDHNIPYIDLHKTVTDICAPNPPHNYVNCSLCRMEPCSFHYNPAGYGPIAAAVATAFRSAL